MIAVHSPYNALFVCTGNATRSIMAEAILAAKGAPNFVAFSAGTHPLGYLHPKALRQIELAGLSHDGLRSKSWNEFARPGASQMDFILTVCDNAAKEARPVWPGQPLTAHWGVPDPGYTIGTPEEVERAFREVFMTLDRRIGLLLSLPLATLDRAAIQKEIDRIGRD
jgi:arsenate reductase (thioredoxin)